MKKIFVGIDVCEARFDVAFRNSDCQPVRGDSSFTNSSEGIRDLIGCCVASASLVGKKTKIIIGMESTSNFHKNLERALRASSRKFEIHVINPLSIKQFKKMNLKVYKTDRLDAHMIAAYLAKMTPKPSFAPLNGQEELKEITRLRRSFQEETTKLKNRLRRLLRIHFPGYKQLLGMKISAKMLVAFSNFSSPEEILSISIDSIADFSIAFRHKIGRTFAENLIKLAQQAPARTLQNGNALVIKWTAQSLLQLQERIKILDKEIVSMLDKFFPEHKLHTIPGIGPISIATIIAEVGNIKRFATPEKFIGYVGLYPVVWESGEMKTRFQMTNKGNKSLKMTFLVASAAARRFNPVIRQMYDRLRERGKSKKAAGGAIARKLACIVYAIFVSNQEWDPKIAAESLKKSQQMVESDLEKKKGTKRLTEIIPQNAVNAAIEFKSPLDSPGIIQSGGVIENP
jgi:transposase